MVESVGKHLDALAELIKWALLVALVSWWAGFEGLPTVDALGMKIPREDALWASIIVYIAVNSTTLVLLIRLGDLLKLVDDPNLLPALGKLSLHPWPLNPFAYFGEGAALHGRFLSSRTERTLFVLVGIGLGGIFAFVTQRSHLL